MVMMSMANVSAVYSEAPSKSNSIHETTQKTVPKTEIPSHSPARLTFFRFQRLSSLISCPSTIQFIVFGYSIVGMCLCRFSSTTIFLDSRPNANE